MSGSDHVAPGQTAKLGDKLLKLIPAPKSAENKPQLSKRTLLGQMLRMGAGDSLGFLGLLVVLSALCGTGVLFLLNSEAKAVEQQSYSMLISTQN